MNIDTTPSQARSLAEAMRAQMLRPRPVQVVTPAGTVVDLVRPVWDLLTHGDPDGGFFVPPKMARQIRRGFRTAKRGRRPKRNSTGGKRY